MVGFILNAIKIIFLLGFLILIHEGGHFLIAKACNVKVKEFAIGFGPTLLQMQGKETRYALRLIPLGGFVNLEGETEKSDDERSFSKASIIKRIAIIAAGAIVNIIFALITYFIIMTIYNPNIFANSTLKDRMYFAGIDTIDFVKSIAESVKNLFIGKIKTAELVGPVGISDVVSKTQSLGEYMYILAIISMSLGVTNLLPFPPLDGGKLLFLIIEAIRKKPLKEETEIKIQLIGFSILITLSIYIAYKDILKIF